MRVGYVLKRYPRYSETFIVNEILAHEAAGLEVEIFALRHPNDEHFQDVISRVRAPVTYLRSQEIKASRLWTALERLAGDTDDVGAALASAWGEDVTEVYQALELARLVRRRGLDHLHAHFATSATSVARLAARFAGLSYTFTAHAKDIFHEDVDPDDLRRKLEDAHAVVTVSDFNVDFLHESYAGASDRVARIYNGMDLERLGFDADGQRDPLILAVGRLVEKKGFRHLVEACRLLCDRGVDYRCRIIGTGPVATELVEQIDELGVGDRVELVGPRPQAEVLAELRRAAVFAAPCVVGADGNRDGLPTVLLEAMALGTPCVSTDVTGIPEILRDGDTGLLVRQGDSDELADACARLIAGQAEARAIAARARRLIEREFDVTRNVARLRDIFASAVQATRAPGAEAVRGRR